MCAAVPALRVLIVDGRYLCTVQDKPQHLFGSSRSSRGTISAMCTAEVVDIYGIVCLSALPFVYWPHSIKGCGCMEDTLVAGAHAQLYQGGTF